MRPSTATTDAPAYVRQLEVVHDQRLEATVTDEGDIAAELDAFLREQQHPDEPG